MTEKSGVFEGISNTDYHEGEGISSSQIKVLATKTPLHYYDKYVDETREREVRDIWGALAVGTLFHTLLLEPDKPIEEDILVVEEINRRSKVGKENFAAHVEEASAGGRNIVTRAEYDNVVKMVATARKQPLFNRLFTGGRAETSCYWTDPDTGILCKCRPDYLHEDNIIVDLKSCIDASKDGAGKASFNFGYYISAAFYIDGVARATGKPADTFIFAFMEKARPYATAPYVITEQDIALGRAMYKSALSTLAACTKSDRWPGYTSEILELEIPEWARKQIRNTLSEDM